MPENLLQTGGAGGAGALLGSFLTFIGFKRRIEQLEEGVVYKDTCEAKVKGMEDALHTTNEMLTEMRTDIKQILKNGK